MERGRPFPSSSSFEGLRLRERPGLSAALPPKQLGEELLSAAAAGDLSRLLDAVVRLESGQDICNFNGPKQRTPLHLACLAGSEVCLDLLLRHTTMVRPLPLVAASSSSFSSSSSSSSSSLSSSSPCRSFLFSSAFLFLFFKLFSIFSYFFIFFHYFFFIFIHLFLK